MLLYKLVKAYTNVAAVRGITKSGRHLLRAKLMAELSSKLSGHSFSTDASSITLQDVTFPPELLEAEKIIVILISERNGISGGIFSLFSIATQMRRLMSHDKYEVVMMTLPSSTGKTYFRNTFFRNSENIYRFSQLSLCAKAKEVYIHIPEYATEKFIEFLSQDDCNYLKMRDKVYINILNQNVRMMPAKETFSPLRDIADEVSQSVGHHAYFSQEIADKFGLPTLLLPAYTDLSAYAKSSFSEKEKLIIYSPDEASYKQQCLTALAQKMPDFKLVEIRNISFDKYMDLATRCMFSITFGEGFDGYLAQPIHQGGIGFSVFNEDFFPSPVFLRHENIFANEGEMVGELCERMLSLSKNQSRFEQLNQALIDDYQRFYSFDDYVNQIKNLLLRKFEYFPSSEI